MADFDDIVTDSAAAFMSALSTSTTAIYYPKNRPKVENITVMYDKKVFEPDPLTDSYREGNPRVTIETAAISGKAKMKDQIAFNGIRVEVEHNEGDEMGLTSLRVRVINE